MAIPVYQRSEVRGQRSEVGCRKQLWAESLASDLKPLAPEYEPAQGIRPTPVNVSSLLILLGALALELGDYLLLAEHLLLFQLGLQVLLDALGRLGRGLLHLGLLCGLVLAPLEALGEGVHAAGAIHELLGAGVEG